MAEAGVPASAVALKGTSVEAQSARREKGQAMTRRHATPRTFCATAALLAFAVALVSTPHATADSANVRVTATIAPTFSLTLLTDGTVDFGPCALGGVYTAPEQQRFRVISGRPWDFTDSSETRVVVGGVDIPRNAVLKHAVSLGFGQGLAAGTYEITCTYTADLSSSDAARLPANTPIGANFGYSAVQR